MYTREDDHHQPTPNPPPALAQAIVQSLPNALYTCDAQGFISWFNPAAADLWGHSPELGKERPDGVHRRVLPETRALYGPDGSVVGTLNILAELSDGNHDAHREQQHWAAREPEAVDGPETVTQARDRLLALLSHELRTPLAPVLVTVAGMESDPYLPERLRSDISMVRRNVELESKLIDDLLDFSRSVSGKLEMNPERIDLNEALHQICAICRPQIIEKHLRFDVNLDPAAGQVHADPARLQQVMWNLLRNAIKFTPDGGSIWVRTEKASEGLTAFAVRDSGVGIAPDAIARIFDAFGHASRTSQQNGGLKLGLAISKSLVERSNGTLSVHSDGVGKGATFRVVLPLAAPREKTLSRGNGAGTMPAIRLLLVEDHNDTALALAKFLDASGISVTRAAYAAEAFNILCKERFDLIMSDIGLPDATGYDLMKRIRERWNIAGIAMSGYGMDEDIRKSHEAGFSEHLVKPVKMAQLEEVIRRLVGKNTAQTAPIHDLSTLSQSRIGIRVALSTCVGIAKFAVPVRVLEEEHPMKTFSKTHCAAICGALLLGLALTACEHRVVETTKTTDGPNGSSVQKKTVTENNDGTVTESKETRTTNNP